MKTTRAPKRKPEEIDRESIKEIELSPEDWQEFEHGVNLFNACKFWHAHEAWEQVWQRHSEDERLFLQGLIQLAAAYHHLVTKKSFKGLINNFEKAGAKLEVFQSEFMGINVDPILKAIQEGKQEAHRLGEGGLEQFGLNLIPKLQFHKPYNPDLMVEIRSFIASEKFREGVGLFNQRYYWEAHEAWEEAWRDQHGDGKMFSQAFVQMAAGYSFIKLSKYDSVRYLFEKSIEKFRQFESLACGIPIRPLIDEMESAITQFLSQSGNGKTFKLTSSPSITLP